MFKCPHCGERTVSPFKKLFLGPMFENRCDSCEKHWGISRLSVPAVAVVVGCYFAFLTFAHPSRLLAQAGGVVALLCAGAVLVFLVPVVRK